MPRNRTAEVLIVLITVATAMMSCNRKTVYAHYEPTPMAGWENSDTLTFTTNPMETDGNYKEEIGVRISGAYPFTKLCLIIDQTIMPAGITLSDTLFCRLFSDDGTVKGRGVSRYQYRFHLTDIRLNQGDSLCVSIRHNMRREILPGISDIGVSLERN